MKELEYQTLSDAELLTAYKTAASFHMKAVKSGDFEAGNRQYKIIENCYRELRSRGEESQKKLLGLLDSSDDGVRVWSASHALEFSPDIAQDVLQELELKNDLIGLTAHYTLKEWQKGSLKFP